MCACTVNVVKRCVKLSFDIDAVKECVLCFIDEHHVFIIASNFHKGAMLVFPLCVWLFYMLCIAMAGRSIAFLCVRL